MSLLAIARLPVLALSAPQAARTACPTPPPRRTGPVLMGDLHTSWGGTPMLLLEWQARETEKAAKKGR